MESEAAKGVKAGYRTVGILVVAGFACIGFTRLEDRAIIGPHGFPANAMSAFVAADGDDTGESYSDAPEDAVPLNRASRAPGSRIRRIVKDGNVPSVAARQIVGPPPASTAGSSGDSFQPGLAPAIAPELAATASPAPTFASLAPALPGTGTPVFAADGTPGGGGGGSSGGGGGTHPNPVSPVPEPSTWLMLILGLFGIGAAMRHGTQQRRGFAVFGS